MVIGLGFCCCGRVTPSHYACICCYCCCGRGLPPTLPAYAAAAALLLWEGHFLPLCRYMLLLCCCGRVIPSHFACIYCCSCFAAVGGSFPPTLPAYAAALLPWVILSHSACILGVAKQCFLPH